MSRISDYPSTDDGSATSYFKQNFDLVSPEELQYDCELIYQEFEELNRKSCIFGYPFPQKIVDLRKWMEEHLHPQLQLQEHEPEFYHNILVIRKVLFFV